jgi:cobalt transporter subunit CbtB
MATLHGNSQATSVHDQRSNAAASVWRDRIAPALAALLLGGILIYAAGFASRVELHNAAHDGRHSAGFPCH